VSSASDELRGRGTAAVLSAGPSRWLAPVLLSTTLFLVGTVAVVNVSLGDLDSELGFTSASLSWVVNGYLLAYGGMLVFGGRLGDVLGSRTTLLIGLVVFFTGAAIGSAASTPGMLIAARVLQGLGAAFASPAVLGLLSSAYPDARRGVMVSAWTATTSAGFSLGLVAGGAIEQWLNWRWIFLLSLPVAAVLLVASALVVPAIDRRRQSLDPLGAVLVTAGTSALVFGLVSAAARDVIAVVSFAGAVLLLAGFVWRMRTAAEPLVPGALFASPARLGAFVAAALSGAAITGMLFVLTRFFSNTLLLSPLSVGAAFLFFSVSAIVGTVAADRSSARWSGRAVGTVGFGVASLGMVLLTRLGGVDDFDVWIAIAMVLVGLGVGAGQLAANRQALTTVPGHLAGAASGMLQTCLQLGAAVGTALLVWVAEVAPIGAVFGMATAILVVAMALIAGTGARSSASGPSTGEALTAGHAAGGGAADGRA